MQAYPHFTLEESISETGSDGRFFYEERSKPSPAILEKVNSLVEDFH